MFFVIVVHSGKGRRYSHTKKKKLNASRAATRYTGTHPKKETGTGGQHIMGLSVSVASFFRCCFI